MFSNQLLNSRLKFLFALTGLHWKGAVSRACFLQYTSQKIPRNFWFNGLTKDSKVHNKCTSFCTWKLLCGFHLTHPWTGKKVPSIEQSRSPTTIQKCNDHTPHSKFLSSELPVFQNWNILKGQQSWFKCSTFQNCYIPNSQCSKSATVQKHNDSKNFVAVLLHLKDSKSIKYIIYRHLEKSYI